jgi:hypothetical protein
MRDNEDHIPDTELAVLVEKALQGDLPGPAKRHLASCPSCFATFAELTRARTGAQAGRFNEIPADFLELGRAVGRDSHKAAEQPVPATRRPRWLLPAAVSLAAVLCLAIFWSVPRSDREDALAGSRQVLATSLQEDSRQGLVHLGMLHLEPIPRTIYRNGNSPESSQARTVLAQLSREQGPELPSAELVYWRAAGYLAIAELGMARNLLDDARQIFPEDWRFRFLTAHLAYKESDLPLARDILSRLAEQRPDDGTVLVDLGLVLSELEDPAGARILARIVRDFPDTYLAKRVRDLP